MRHGVLFYEAMGLIRSSLIFRFGVFFYEATRLPVANRIKPCLFDRNPLGSEVLTQMKLTKLLRSLKGVLLSALIVSLSVSMTGCGLVGFGVKTAISLIPLKLMFNCLPEGAEIDTPVGSQPVESLRPGDMVIGFKGKPVKVMQIQGYVEDHSVNNFVKVEFEDGAVVDLCKLHRIHGIRAGKLEIGQELKSGHIVKSIETYGGVERSYDILTEDKGYRIGGVPVNSMIEEMYESGLKQGKMKE